ncbi:type II secretion system protein [Rhodoligotrophos defluvii]|uniref:type II secretion system protein n=1 Tax=Rhodoligotrophos defluvii TaxID=2561934 RepID=UPI001485B119
MNRRDGQRGFSLLECLVALTILGLASAILYPSFSDAMRSRLRASEDTLAALEAQSVLALAGHAIPLAAGTYQVETRLGAWSVDIRMRLGTDPRLNVFDITATLRDKGRRGHQFHATRVSLRQ